MTTRRTTEQVAAYICEYLDPGNHLGRDDDPAETVALLDQAFASEGGAGVTVEEMRTYLESLPSASPASPRS